MGLLTAGLLIFLGIHSVGIVAPAWREAQIAQHGERTWKGLYSIVSILGFALLLYGYGIAREAPTLLYAPPAFLRHLAPVKKKRCRPNGWSMPPLSEVIEIASPADFPCVCRVIHGSAHTGFAAGP